MKMCSSSPKQLEPLFSLLRRGPVFGPINTHNLKWYQLIDDCTCLPRFHCERLLTACYWPHPGNTCESGSFELEAFLVVARSVQSCDTALPGIYIIYLFMSHFFWRMLRFESQQFWDIAPTSSCPNHFRCTGWQMVSTWFQKFEPLTFFMRCQHVRFAITGKQFADSALSANVRFFNELAKHSSCFCNGIKCTRGHIVSEQGHTWSKSRNRIHEGQSISVRQCVFYK
jgi:hypothetical protein